MLALPVSLSLPPSLWLVVRASCFGVVRSQNFHRNVRVYDPDSPVLRDSQTEKSRLVLTRVAWRTSYNASATRDGRMEANPMRNAKATGWL